MKLLFARVTLTLILLLPLLSAKAQSTGRYKKVIFDWYPTSTYAPAPAVLVLGGSEGGKGYGKAWAAVLNSRGYHVMDLAYFGITPLNEQLEGIPLEYFQHAWDTLSQMANVDPSRMAIIAVSKGTEPALWLAAQNPSVKVVVAASPSHAVWQSVNRQNYSSVASSWTLQDKPHPFIAYDYSRGTYPIANFYLKGVERNEPIEAILPVERIEGTIILLSGGKDRIWPSSKMASLIESRYRSQRPNGNIIARDFPNAGHGFLLPFEDVTKLTKLLNAITPNLGFLGGDSGALHEAVTESQKLVLTELAKMNR